MIKSSAFCSIPPVAHYPCKLDDLQNHGIYESLLIVKLDLRQSGGMNDPHQLHTTSNNPTDRLQEGTYIVALLNRHLPRIPQIFVRILTHCELLLLVTTTLSRNILDTGGNPVCLPEAHTLLVPAMIFVIFPWSSWLPGARSQGRPGISQGHSCDSKIEKKEKKNRQGIHQNPPLFPKTTTPEAWGIWFVASILCFVPHSA